MPWPRTHRCRDRRIRRLRASEACNLMAFVIIAWIQVSQYLLIIVITATAMKRHKNLADPSVHLRLPSIEFQRENSCL